MSKLPIIRQSSPCRSKFHEPCQQLRRCCYWWQPRPTYNLQAHRPPMPTPRNRQTRDSRQPQRRPTSKSFPSLRSLHFPDFHSLAQLTVEPNTAAGQVRVVNRHPVKDGDVLLFAVSLQRHDCEVEVSTPVEQVAGFWFVLHM